ncbi:hypothetical protein AQ505_17310 [Pedobacter sp. PACM 27299]|nr:hypothetical protein AQ505_17310 [Pedobacter sp. PACM 27299]
MIYPFFSLVSLKLIRGFVAQTWQTDPRWASEYGGLHGLKTYYHFKQLYIINVILHIYVIPTDTINIYSYTRGFNDFALRINFVVMKGLNCSTDFIDKDNPLLIAEMSSS